MVGFGVHTPEAAQTEGCGSRIIVFLLGVQGRGEALPKNQSPACKASPTSAFVKRDK